MTARDEVVTTLDAALNVTPGTAVVMPYAREIDPPALPTVMVRIDEVRVSTNPQAWRDYRFALVLVPTKTAPGPADDELDGFLEDVLFAIDGADTIQWEVAHRATYNELPAYEVILTVTFTV